MKQFVDSAGTTFTRGEKIDIINLYLINTSEKISIIKSIPAKQKHEIDDLILLEFPKNLRILEQLGLFAVYDGDIISTGYLFSNTSLSNKNPVRLPLKMYTMDFGNAKLPKRHKRNDNATLARFAYMRDMEGNQSDPIKAIPIYGRVLVEAPDLWHEIHISGSKMPLYYAKMIMHLLETLGFDYSLNKQTWTIWCKDDSVVSYLEELFKLYMDNCYTNVI